MKCANCKRPCMEHELFWEYPDWPFSCDLVCGECVPHYEDSSDKE